MGCGRLRSPRRWTTVGQSAEGHPTAPPRRWQAFFSRPAARSPIRASHCRDDSVPREEPHVLFVRVASALKGLDISAQGKATRVVRASGRSTDDNYASGNGSGNSHRASEKQINFATNLAKGIRGLGVRRLE